MMYEATFRLPESATYTIKVEADNKDEAIEIAAEQLMNTVIIDIKEEVSGDTILNWIIDNLPSETDEILLRTDTTSAFFETHSPAQMKDLANRLYSVFEDFAKNNFDDECSTVGGLFNYCTAKANPDFEDICDIYYKNFCDDFLLVF